MDLIFILLVLFVFTRKRVDTGVPISRNPEFIHEQNIFREYYDYLMNLKNI